MKLNHIHFAYIDQSVFVDFYDFIYVNIHGLGVGMGVSEFTRYTTDIRLVGLV